jgi:signal transduction histidine kinase
MFLGILSHDLRNPLNAIMISARALLRTCELDLESSRLASGVSTSADAMARMIGDLLDFTAAGLGAAMPLSPVAMDLESLCREVVEETRAAHPSADVRFQAHGDLTGEWDAGRLRQVLSNLLGNAVHHGRGAGPVEVSADGRGSHVRLAVRNGGPPIPPDAVPTIFDRRGRRVSAAAAAGRGDLGSALFSDPASLASPRRRGTLLLPTPQGRLQLRTCCCLPRATQREMQP